MMKPPAEPFRAFTINSPGLLNRIITRIEVTEAFDPKGGTPTGLHRVDTTALWDTGASASVISSEVATTLGLVPVGIVRVNHAGGVGQSKTYIVNFMLPNMVCIVGVEVTEMPHVPGGIGALIGMDIISQGDLSITNLGGKTCMSFRMPSCHVVDFVAEANRNFDATVGRNDLCPCGSGRKFKRCHGAHSSR